MTTTTNIAELERWLQATSLSEEEQKDFVARYSAEGKWTPALAEEFAIIMSKALKDNVDELRQYTDELEKRNQEFAQIEREMESEYKILITNEYKEMTLKTTEIQKAVDDTQKSYKDDVDAGTKMEVNDILTTA